VGAGWGVCLASAQANSGKNRASTARRQTLEFLRSTDNLISFNVPAPDYIQSHNNGEFHE
jgi:hypothetical protein